MIRYNARWLLPVSAPPIEHGTVAVDGSRIAYVGPRAGAPAAGRDVELGEALLMPGLVNAHCQLELAPVRGVLGGLPPHERLALLARLRRGALGEGAMLDGARAAVAEGLRAGVTTFADVGVSDAGIRAMTELGARGLAFQEFSGPSAGDRSAVLDALRSRLDALRSMETPLVRLGVAPHSVHAVHEDLLVDASALAIAERLPIAIRVAESDAEIAFIREGEGPYAERLRVMGVDVVRRSYSPVHLLRELGIADVASPLLLHCVKLDESDVAFIADSGCTVALCPGESAREGAGVAPLDMLLAAGVAVGLGSGLERIDLLDEARLAAQQQQSLPSGAALDMATRGGARALRLDARVGTLEVGKEADLAAFPLPSVHGRPIHEPSATLHDFAGIPASFVAVAGRPRVVAGQLVDPLDPAIAARARDSAEAIRRWLADATL